MRRTARFRRLPARCSSAVHPRRSTSGVSSTTRRGRRTATSRPATTRSKRFTGLVGIDANVGNAAILGVDAGYLTNHVRDSQFGDTAKGNGWTVGAYGVYDPGAFFVKGMGTYANLNGDSSRHINFAGLAPGATFSANPNGSPDVKMYTLGPAWRRQVPDERDLGGHTVPQPRLCPCKMDGFTETNGNGAGLTVESATSSHTFLTGGVKWATQMGGVVPEMNLGYRYRFGEQRSDFRAFFNGDTDCDFDIISAAQKRGTSSRASASAEVGPVDLRIGYEGEFNGDVTSHSGNFKFVVPLGGHAAPPPPPPPAASASAASGGRAAGSAAPLRLRRRLRRRSSAASAASKQLG